MWGAAATHKLLDQTSPMASKRQWWCRPFRINILTQSYARGKQQGNGKGDTGNAKHGGADEADTGDECQVGIVHCIHPQNGIYTTNIISCGWNYFQGWKNRSEYWDRTAQWRNDVEGTSSVQTLWPGCISFWGKLPQTTSEFDKEGSTPQINAGEIVRQKVTG